MSVKGSSAVNWLSIFAISSREIHYSAMTESNEGGPWRLLGGGVVEGAAYFTTPCHHVENKLAVYGISLIQTPLPFSVLAPGAGILGTLSF